MVVSKAATVDSAYVLTILSYLIILTRLGLRQLKHEHFKVDDYLMFGAMFWYFMFTLSYPIAIYGGNNSSVGIEDMLPEEASKVSFFVKWIFIGRLFYIAYLWTLKTCLLIFYTRLTERKVELLVIKGVGAILIATWMAAMLTVFLGCRPLHLMWQVRPIRYGCSKAIAAVYVVGLSNIMTDLLLIVIPVHIIARTQLPIKRKLELVFIFTLGLFAIVIVTLRMINTTTYWQYQSRLIWGQLECFTSTIVANAPILHGLWRHAWVHLGSLKFGRNADCPPAYNMAIHRPTEQTEVAPSVINDLPIPGSRSGRARLSLRRMRDKLRKSLGGIEIERSVVLLQESQTGNIDRRSRDDMSFAGNASIAQIVTSIGTGMTFGGKEKVQESKEKKFGLLWGMRSAARSTEASEA